MEAFFKWSKVYDLKHEHGSYFIFTAEHSGGKHVGIMLPSAMDDIWNMAGSRLTHTIEAEPHPAVSHDEVLQRLSSWTSRNFQGKFVITPASGMTPPAEVSLASLEQA